MTNAPYLKLADSGIWYVHWTVGRIGKRVSTRTANQADAAAFFVNWLRSIGKTDASAPVLLSGAWAFYRSKRQLAGEYNADLAWKQLDPHFGKLNAADLSQAIVDDYVDKRISGQLGRAVKPQTAAKELSYLMAAIRFCADPRRGILPPNTVVRFDLPAAGDPRDRWLRTDEIRKMLAAAKRLNKSERLSRGERFLHLALETAGRKEALLELTWDRVDFETGMISLNVPGRRKTKKRRADVPISASLRPVLLRAHEERENGFVLDHGGDIWTTIQTIAIEAGLSERQTIKRGHKPKATGISPHVLRHTAATHMARRGVSLFLISKILGNTIAVVERTYAKYSPGDLQKAVDLITNGEL